MVFRAFSEDGGGFGSWSGIARSTIARRVPRRRDPYGTLEFLDVARREHAGPAGGSHLPAQDHVAGRAAADLEARGGAGRHLAAGAPRDPERDHGVVGRPSP